MANELEISPEVTAKAAAFFDHIAGFEGDELQTGVDDLLADIRSSIQSEARL